MKKLLIAATAAMLGIVANAASYNWKAQNDGYSADGENPLAGTVYLFDGTANTIAAITEALSDSSTLGKALDSAVLDEGAFMIEGTGLDEDPPASLICLQWLLTKRVMGIGLLICLTCLLMTQLRVEQPQTLVLARTMKFNSRPSVLVRLRRLLQ